MSLDTTETFIADLVNLHRARFPLIYVITHEERRGLAAIAEAAKRRGAKTRSSAWKFTTGWTSINETAAVVEYGKDKQDPLAALSTIVDLDKKVPTFCVLCDFDPFMEDAGVIRRLRDLDALLRTEGHCTTVILSPRLARPVHLEKALYVMDFPLPDPETVQTLVTGSLTAVKAQIADQGNDPVPVNDVVRLLAGLTYDEADNIVAKSLVAKKTLDLDLITTEKQAAIKHTDVLEVITPTESLAQVGGHDLLKQFLQEAQTSFSPEAREFGVEPIRGALFVGIPGTGKSYVVKAAAHDWHLPLLRVDVGRLMSSLVGASESRAREMTKIAEAIAPCVLMFDEVEKGIGGVESSAQSDSGTTARVFGHLLTFMQETTAPVAVLATANDAELLPPEFLRRFDAIYWFDTPDDAERHDIWAIHLRKRGRDPKKFNLSYLVEHSDGYTGAEIEKAIKQSLRRAFLAGKKDLVPAQIINALKDAEPLAKSRSAQIETAKKALGGLAQPTRSSERPGRVMSQTPRSIDLN